MTQTNINIRIDLPTKKKAEKVFKDLGMNMSSAINVFLKQCIKENGIPFNLTNETLNRETVKVIKNAKRGKSLHGPYKNVNDCIRAMTK